MPAFLLCGLKNKSIKQCPVSTTSRSPAIRHSGTFLMGLDGQLMLRLDPVYMQLRQNC